MEKPVRTMKPNTFNMKKKCLFFLPALFSLIYDVSAQNINYADLMKDYDVKHYNLDLQISNASAIISGNVTITSLVTSATLNTFVIELVNTTTAAAYNYMIVDSVKINNSILSFLHNNDLIIIPLTRPIIQGELFTARVFYHGLASAGEFQTFLDGTLLTHDGITVIKNQKQSFSMSESRGAKLWWPCKQDLSDKADSVTFYITTDSKNKSGSNGILRSAQLLPNDKVRYKWVTKYPIDYYLVSFVVGPYTENTGYAFLQDKNDSVLVQSLINKNSPFYSKNLKGINSTKELITIYSELFGDYPFKKEKYGYCSVDTATGAMENQTMTTINSSWLDTIPVTFSDNSSTWVTAHELGHSWFGDYVTCKTWNDIWINEGFASYLEYLALEKMQLNPLAKKWIYMAHRIASQSLGSVYVRDSELKDDRRVFNFYLTYKKGASILHTLRYEINNDTLFFKGLRDFLNKYSFSVASAVDFKNTMELTTGMDLTEFFNQWYYGYGYPVFNITWAQKSDTLFIKTNQTTLRTETPLFKTHFDVKMNFLSGDSTVRLYQNTNYQIFKIPIKKQVTSIEFDPDDWILKRIESLTSVVNNISDNTDIINVYPNPFDKSVNFEFFLDKSQPVKIDILSINGTFIKTEVFDGVAGKNITTTGAYLSKGVYLYRLTINGIIKSGKLIKL